MLIAATSWAPDSAAYKVPPSGDSAMPMTPVWPVRVVTVLPDKLVTRMALALLSPLWKVVSLPSLMNSWLCAASTAIW